MDEICADLGEHEEVIGRRTGLTLTADHSGVKLAWLRRHLTTGGVATTSDSWLLHQLTGEFVTEMSTAGRSLLAGLGTLNWDPTSSGCSGWRMSRCPRSCLPTESSGRRSLSAVRSWWAA